MIERPDRVTVRFSDEEHRELREQADVAALSVSEYVRRRVLGRRVAAKTDLKLLAELRRIGGLLKYIHLQTRGGYSELTAEAIRNITRFIRTFDRNGFHARHDETAGGPSEPFPRESSP